MGSFVAWNHIQEYMISNCCFVNYEPEMLRSLVVEILLRYILCVDWSVTLQKDVFYWFNLGLIAILPEMNLLYQWATFSDICCYDLVIVQMNYDKLTWIANKIKVIMTHVIIKHNEYQKQANSNIKNTVEKRDASVTIHTLWLLSYCTISCFCEYL